MDDNNKVNDNNDTINNIYNDPNYTIKETDLGTQISHPAYGMLAFSRITGGNQTLFGSSIKHHDIIGMTIRHGDVTRGLNKDWYHGSDEIIHVEMSYSQFAEAITSLNQGTGVPCTIKFQAGKGAIPECDFINKRIQFVDEFNKTIDDCIKDADEILNETDKILAKKSIGKADRAKIANNMKRIAHMINDNSSFIFRQFQEQMDKTITEAKGEIEAFTQNKLNAIASQTLVEHHKELQKLENPVNIDYMIEKGENNDARNKTD